MIHVEKLHLNKWHWWKFYRLFLCNLKQCLYSMDKRKMRQPVQSAFLVPDSVFGHSLPLLQKAKGSDEEQKEKNRRLREDLDLDHSDRFRDIWAYSSVLNLDLLVTGKLDDGGYRDTWAGWKCARGGREVHRCNVAVFVWAQTNKVTVLTLTASCAVSGLLR